MRIALVQMQIDMSQRQANLARALAWMERAARLEPPPDVICLPECCDFGWLSQSGPDEAEPFGGGFVETLAGKACQLGVYLVVGFTDRDGDRVYNAAAMFDPQGRPILTHRKINVLDIARDLYAVGGELRTAATPFGRVGLTICADSWVSCITRTLAMMGVRIVFSPCAWACEAGNESDNLEAIKNWYRDRTKESDVYLVGINGVGRVTEGVWQGRILHGNSLVYGPGGRGLLCGPTNEETLLTLEVSVD